MQWISVRFYDERPTRARVRTSVWAANEAGSHADVSEPLDRMETNVSRDERRIEVVDSFDVLVDVATELLRII